MKKWFVHYIGGQKWTIYLVSSKSKHLLSDDGDRCNGHCLYEECKIFVNCALNEGALNDTLVHELLHAWLRVSNAASIYEFDSEKDEALVRALTPVLHRSLTDLGLRFPPHT